MSEARKMTAAQLTAPTDDAAAVWNGVLNGELSVTHMEQDAKVNVWGFALHDGQMRFDTEYEGVYDTYPLPPDEPMLIEPTRLGEVLAERNAAQRIVAAVERELATLPEQPRYMSAFLNEAHYAAYETRYEVRQQFERAIADARKGDAK